ncbi:MAG: asparagine synthase (glutamine-hydrolyzing) [Candidatus Rokuibacteriota bacterium]|nr:MAG: asparagine synthase (glutamine-hydrolyzing) [Candidatus Rokubacteria bacterium]PYM70323.1 MAG: asparagine synthase (glutamine-hydrolyzing) [Candidatus Rokubacteria bacterium]
MCGLAGLMRLDGRVTVEDVGAVLRMLDAQDHRGPDDWGLLLPDAAARSRELGPLLGRLDPAHVMTYPVERSSATTVLGVRRLAILDRSPRGRMPMGSANRRGWLAYNGETYNYRELRAELGPAESFSSGSDTEVLLRAFDTWGEAALARLRGMFGLAYFQAGPTPTLLLARDRFGIKPLYWHEDRRRVLFASEVTAIVRGGLVPDEASGEALARFLEWGSVPSPLTTVKDVRALPPGHILKISSRGARVERYWDLDGAVEAARRAAPRAAADAVVATRERLEESVRLHLVSDVPLGVFLSGGIDSSALAALAAEGRPQPLTTLSVAFEERALSEAAYARRMAARVGADHHEVLLRAPDVFADLGAFFAAMDQPTVDGLNTWCIARAAREAGLTVVLSGLGGDEVFWGYDHLRRTAALGLARAVMAALPAAVRRGVTRLGPMAGALLARPGLDRLAALEAPTPPGVYHLVRGLFPRATVRDLLGASEGDLEAAAPALTGDARAGAGDLRETLTRLEFSHYLGDQLLRDTDVMGMAHSIEARVPYLDHRLVETVLGLPAALKLDRARPKPLLLDALGDRLPREIWDRPKMGFTFPMAAWMRERAPELERLCLEDKRLQRSAVEAVWSAFAAGRSHWSRPWALLVLARFGPDRRERLAA